MSENTNNANPPKGNDVDLSQHEAPSVAADLEGTPKTDDFFDQLDKQVMGSVLTNEEPSAETSVATSQEAVTPLQDSVEGDGVDYAKLEKRYSDSSREAQRLNHRLKELEPYMPVLEAMKEDPNLVSHVRGYFEGGGSAPQDLKTELGLDEDFMFDYDDAVADPKSDSGKLFQATVDGVVQRRISEFAQTQAKQNAQKAEEKSFRASYNIDDTEYNDLVNYAKSKKLTLEDVYYLKNRNSRDQKVAENVQKSNMEQMRKAREGTPQSIASVGNQVPVETSVDDAVFDQLLGVGDKLSDLGL
tara:strand:- start:31794 stop:32696 length:903 start_codon:yes stop_codon:yes gene_type:complete